MTAGPAPSPASAGPAPAGPVAPPVPDGLPAQRIARLREQLAVADHGAVLCCGLENIAYASGYRSSPGSHRRAQRMAVLVTADDYRLVGPASEAVPALDAGVDLDHYLPYGDFYYETSRRGDPVSALSGRDASLPDAVARALRELGPLDRVAVDDADCHPAVRAQVEAAARTAPGSAWLYGVRAVKLPGEVALVRRAAELTEDGIAAAVAALRPGVTERELSAVVAGVMVAGGAFPKFVTVTMGERSAYSDIFATDRAARPGDLVRFDVGGNLDGYSSDIGRTAVLGEPDRRQRRVYDALLAGEQAEIDLCRPGVRTAELFAAAVAAVERHEVLPTYRRQHCGHGVGMEGYDGFAVAPGDRTVLAPGMTLCLETPYYEVGWGGAMVEDAVLVTEDGCELLTRTSRELTVVPA